MATYQIELEDGKVYEIETEPVKKEVAPDRMVGMTGKVSESDYASGKRNVLGNIVDRPQAAVRSFLTGKNPVEAFKNPKDIPSIQNEMLKSYWAGLKPEQSNLFTRAIHSIGGLPVSAAGYAADVATDPRTYLLGAVGKGVQAVGATKIAKPAFDALGRFLTKERRFLKFGKDAVLDIAKKGVSGLDKLDDLAGQKFESELQKIEGKSGTSNITKTIEEVQDMYPDEKFTKLQQIKDRFTPENRLSAEELRNLKQELKKGIPSSVFKGTAEPTALQRAQLKVYNSVDDELVGLGGEKYIKMKAEYRDWKNTASDAYKALLEDGRAGDKNLRNWFGYGLTRRQTKALEKTSGSLPNNEQFMQEFYAWRRGQMLKGAAGAAIPAAYLLHRAAAEQIIPQR